MLLFLLHFPSYGTTLIKKKNMERVLPVTGRRRRIEVLWTWWKCVRNSEFSNIPPVSADVAEPIIIRYFTGLVPTRLEFLP
jgi:hypothetical protein